MSSPAPPRPRRGRLLPPVLAGVVILTAALVAFVFISGADDTGPGGGGNGGGGPGSVDGVTFTRWSFAEAARLPDDVALIVKTGCFECAPPDNYPRTVARLYRDGHGTLRYDTVFAARPPQALLPPAEPLPEGAYILEAVAKPGGGAVVVTVCITGGCTQYDKPVDHPLSAVYQSTDGGVTWAELGRFEGVPVSERNDSGVARAIGVARDGIVLWKPGDGTRDAQYLLFPSGSALVPPNGNLARRPDVTLEGDIAWLGRNGSGGDGNWELQVAGAVRPLPQPPKGATVSEPLFFAPDGRVVILSTIQRTGDPEAWPRFAVVADESGKVGVAFSGLRVVPVAMLAGGKAVGQVTVPVDRRGTIPLRETPALIDFATGVVNPISVPFAGPGDRTPAIVLAAQRGPFVRVSRRDACAEVHAMPDPSSTVRGCYSAGVLLTHLDGPSDLAWLIVSAPDGTQGFISAADVAR